MVADQVLYTLTIPNWVSKVQIGVIPITYLIKGDTVPEAMKGFKTRKVGKDHYYIDNKNKKIVKNPNSKGKPKFWNLNGQDFYSNNMHWKTRTTIVNFYHKYFAGFIKKEFKEPFPTLLSYKLDMEVIIYDTYTVHTPDITNMWILPKLIEDTYVKLGILRDDSPEFRGHTGFGYVFVEKEEERKLVINFKYRKNNEKN